MKALWLTSSFPRHPSDSASVFLRHLALALQREGVEIHVLMPDHPDIAPDDAPIRRHPFRYAFPRPRQRLAYGSGILPNLRRNPGLYRQIPGFLAAMTWKARRLCRQLRPDLVHAHWIVPQGSIAVLLGSRFDVPTLVTAHGGDAFALQKGPLPALKRWTLNRADAWTSNTAATAAAAGVSRPAIIIPMGVDFDHFSGGDPTDLIPLKDGQPLILFVGRLVEKKGVGDLLDAFARLVPALACRLWIIGDGEQRPALEAQARRLGLGDKVRFWGRRPHHELPAFYAAADLFAAPSVTDRRGDTEGQGVVFLEAMASATAVIATRTGGIEEVIEDGRHGLLVEPGDPDALAAAMTRLLRDENLRHRLARQGQRQARGYAWPVIGRRFAELYRQLAE